MNWKAIERDSLYLLGAYIVLFLWVVARTIYQDHSDLVFRSKGLGQALQTQKTSDATLLQSTKDSFNASMTNLRVDCGIKEGMNSTLQKQNRDQQNTINNCQTQALKLLAPEPFKIIPLTLDPASNGFQEQHVKILILTNRTVTPVHMVVSCNRRFLSADAQILGAGMLSGGTSKLTDTAYQVDISDPAWGPEAPIIFSLSYIGDSHNICHFNER